MKARTTIKPDSPIPAHLRMIDDAKKCNEKPKDIFANLKEEIEQEERDFQCRLAQDGLDGLQEDERELYLLKLKIEKDQQEQKQIIKKLLTEDLYDIDSKAFEKNKTDENLMDEWAK